MLINKGTDINVDWTNSIAVSRNNGLWKTISALNITVSPQRTSGRNQEQKFKIYLLDGIEELEWFFLDEINNQPTWTNDVAGLIQAVLDITSWVSSISSSLDAILNDILTSTQNIEVDTGIISDEVDLKSKAKKWDTVGNDIYVGYAAPGSLTSDPVWAIKKVSESGNDGDIDWADSNKNFDNVWDNRLSLSYG
jgi:hypothetical protein